MYLLLLDTTSILVLWLLWRRSTELDLGVTSRLQSSLIPCISNGPLLFWMHPVFGIRGAS